MNRLALVIPGLLGPMPELEQYEHVSPACPVLQKWLSSAEPVVTGARHYYDLLADLFGIHPEYSITQLSALADDGECAQGYWYRADPVHFKADIDHAIMFDHNRLAISNADAQALVTSFNQHFREDGIELRASHRHRWYLAFKTPLDIQTTWLEDAIGRNVNHFLPTGPDALNWKRLLNETQMLFHNHDVNIQREAKGQLSINSLWLWGEGQEPRSLNTRNWDWVMSEEAVAKGLALWSGIKQVSLNTQHDRLSLPDGNGMIVLDQMMGPTSYGDVQAWFDAVETICEQWFEKLHRLFITKQIQCVELYCADGRMFKLTPFSLLKFWRRKKPVAQYVSLQ